ECPLKTEARGSRAGGGSAAFSLFWPPCNCSITGRGIVVAVLLFPAARGLPSGAVTTAAGVAPVTRGFGAGLVWRDGGRRVAGGQGRGPPGGGGGRCGSPSRFFPPRTHHQPTP